MQPGLKVQTLSPGTPPATPSISAVVPCYNEEDVLDELLRRLRAACEEVVGDDFEIVLVDDGSRDRTRELLREAQSQDPRIVVVLLSRNHGHQLALTAGLNIARGKRVFVLDADLQDPPELLGPMMARMDEGFDVVYGTRRSRAGETRFKLVTARAFYRLLDRIVDVKIPLDTGDFRLISRRVADILASMPERHRFIRGMTSWIGFPQVAFPYDRDVRFAGETKYPIRKMLVFALDAITGFSVLPLRMATALGFMFAAFAIIYGGFVLISWANGAVIAGWTSLALLVLLLGGVQLIMVGVLGEYVGRLYMQSKERPLFVIDEVLRAPADVRTPDRMAADG
ncbi:MAG: glycosyltransferase family 2 protein [Pseudomonadota bacterium]